MKSVLIVTLLFMSALASADEVACKYTAGRVETPADRRLVAHNRYHMGIKIHCVDGPVLNIGNEKLAKKFDDEMNGRAKGSEARLSGMISAVVKKHSGDLFEITSYKWTGSYEDPNLPKITPHKGMWKKKKKSAEGVSTNGEE